MMSNDYVILYFSHRLSSNIAMQSIFYITIYSIHRILYYATITNLYHTLIHPSSLLFNIFHNSFKYEPYII